MPPECFRDWLRRKPTQTSTGASSFAVRLAEPSRFDPTPFTLIDTSSGGLSTTSLACHDSSGFGSSPSCDSGGY
ncbi:hypothetical protein ACFZAE_29050 [Streptomyces scabiei]|uniref:hypothetical protein n=1 Tax=Streptomyces scabiei TaxID=1930 RepID=UPI0036EDE580